MIDKKGNSIKYTLNFVFFLGFLRVIAVRYLHYFHMK